jgi:hypothetical protein
MVAFSVIYGSEDQDCPCGDFCQGYGSLLAVVFYLVYIKFFVPWVIGSGIRAIFSYRCSDHVAIVEISRVRSQKSWDLFFVCSTRVKYVFFGFLIVLFEIIYILRLGDGR